LAGAPTAGILIYQVTTGHLVGDKPASNITLAALTLLISVPMVFSFYFIKLFTVIDTESIYYGFGMTANNLNEVRLADILEMNVVPYQSNGLGMRMSNTFGTIYNTSGGLGLFIVTRQGTKLVIGTKEPEALRAAIEQLKKAKRP
jgi:hypothetical protein